MGILDDLVTVAKEPIYSSRCRTCTILRGLTAEERSAIQEGLGAGSVTPQQVRGVLTRNGHPVSYSSVQRHKNEEHAV